MDNYWVTRQIKVQIDTLVLESILASLDKLTEQIITMRITEKSKANTEEKF